MEPAWLKAMHSANASSPNSDKMQQDDPPSSSEKENPTARRTKGSKAGKAQAVPLPKPTTKPTPKNKRKESDKAHVPARGRNAGVTVVPIGKRSSSSALPGVLTPAEW